MEYALIYTFGNVIEQIGLRYLMDIVHPLSLILLFYIFSVMAACAYAAVRKEFSISGIAYTLRQGPAVTTFLIAESLGTCLWFASVWYIGVSGLAIFGILTKVFKMVYGVRVFHETVTLTQWYIAFGVIGAATVFGTSGDINSVWGTLYALLSAMCYTFSGITQKHIAGKVVYTHIFIIRNFLNLFFVLFAFIATVIIGNLDITKSFNIPFWLFSVIAILGAYGAVFLRLMKIKANETVPLSTLVVVFESNVPLLFLCGFFFLRERMTHIQLLAAGYMIFATAYFVWKFRQDNRI